jgi:hypothetical protein
MLRFLVALVGNDFGNGVENAPILADGTIHFVVGAGFVSGFLLAHFFSLLTIALYNEMIEKSRVVFRC